MVEANETIAKDIPKKPKKFLHVNDFHVNKKKLFYYGLMVIPAII